MELSGFIVHFDERRGDGSFESDAGDRYYFHCVAIADGSRWIRVGARATGVRSVGRRGHDEVRHVCDVS